MTENAVSRLWRKQSIKVFCDQGQFYYGNKANSNNQIFACLGVSLVTINPDN